MDPGLRSNQELIGKTIDMLWEDILEPAIVSEVDTSHHKLADKCKSLTEQSFLAKKNENIMEAVPRIKTKPKHFHSTEEPTLKKRKKTALIKKEYLLQEKDVINTDIYEENEKYKKHIEELENENAMLKNKIIKLEEQLSKQKTKEATSTNIEHLTDIGYGVMIPTQELHFYKSFCSTPQILARNLMRMVFTAEELTTSSLWGKQSNANKNSTVLPALDSKKLNAIIEYSLKGLQSREFKLLEGKVKASLASYMLKLRCEKNKN